MRSKIRSLPADREGPYLGTTLCDLAITILIPQAATMADFIEVTGLEQIRPGAGSRFIVLDKEMAIFNVDGTICAISDHCPHAGGSLGLGKLDGKIVTCPVHGMKFDVTTGCFAGTSDFGVSAYPAKIVDGKVMVSIS